MSRFKLWLKKARISWYNGWRGIPTHNENCPKHCHGEINVK